MYFDRGAQAAQRDNSSNVMRDVCYGCGLVLNDDNIALHDCSALRSNPIDSGQKHEREVAEQGTFA